MPLEQLKPKNSMLQRSETTGITYHVTKFWFLQNGGFEATEKHNVGDCIHCRPWKPKEVEITTVTEIDPEIKTIIIDNPRMQTELYRAMMKLSNDKIHLDWFYAMLDWHFNKYKNTEHNVSICDFCFIFMNW